MGVMGQAYDDFCRLTPDEFAAVYEAYADNADALRRDKWERTRTAAWLALQPYMKKGMRPERMLPLPWDRQNAQPHQAGQRRMPTREERLQRFRQLLERTGEG